MTDQIDELLDLHVESKQKVLELFDVEPSWHGFPLSDERGRWWCVCADEIVSQYQDHRFDEETVRRGWYCVRQLVSPLERSVYTRSQHVLVFVEREFGKAFLVFDLDQRLTQEQSQSLQESL